MSVETVAGQENAQRNEGGARERAIFAPITIGNTVMTT